MVQLHCLCIQKEPYSPSATVKKISAKIASDSGLGRSGGKCAGAPRWEITGNCGKGSRTTATATATGPVDVTETAAETSRRK